MQQAMPHIKTRQHHRCGTQGMLLRGVLATLAAAAAVEGARRGGSIISAGAGAGRRAGALSFVVPNLRPSQWPRQHRRRAALPVVHYSNDVDAVVGMKRPPREGSPGTTPAAAAVAIDAFPAPSHLEAPDHQTAHTLEPPMWTRLSRKQPQLPLVQPTSMVLTTFNLLAPCYKRVDEAALRTHALQPQSLDPDGGIVEALKGTLQGRARESDCDAMWRARARSTLNFLEENVVGSDVICLQEYWMHEAYDSLFRERLEPHYLFHIKKRTGHKADGVAVLLRRGSAAAAATQGASLCTVGNRVALLLHVRRGPDESGDLLLANCHLTFPHNHFDRQLQQAQIAKVTEALDAFAARQEVPLDTPRVIVGDFNVEESDPVCGHLRERGYRSAFSTLHSRERHVVTHLNHNGEEVMVDHVWVWGLTDANVAPSAEHSPAPAQQEQEGQRHEGSRGEGKGLTVGAATLLPLDMEDEHWSRSFALSDHRPLQVKIDWPQPQRFE